MIGIAKILRMALPLLPWEAQGGLPAPADGAKSPGPQSHIHTLLAAGLRIEGNVSFVGGLRIEGEVLGDVLAVGDSNNTIMICKSGKVTGAVRSQFVILNGQVCGSLHSTQSVEVLENGRIIGDIVDCKSVEVHAGGIIAGSLTRTASPGIETKLRVCSESAVSA